MLWEQIKKSIATMLKGVRNIRFQDVTEFLEIQRQISNMFSELLPVGPDVVEKMTYSQAVSYFANHPNDNRIVKGAMLLQPEDRGFLVWQLFLDKSNELVVGSDGKVFGRRLVVRELDAELREFFGGKTLIIFE